MTIDRKLYEQLYANAPLELRKQLDQQATMREYKIVGADLA